jgi:hypothetical protein
MKPTFAAISVLSFTLIVTSAAFGQSSSTVQAKAENLSKQQLSTLIADAKTPAEHERIARFYEAKALDYQAQANEHAAMIAAYKANSSLSNNKNQAATIGHCEYFAEKFSSLAAEERGLSAEHEQMARAAAQK